MHDRHYADEWLPTRFNLGTFRLIAWIVSSSLEKRRPRSGAYLNREGHQHPLEPTLLALAYWLVPTIQFSTLTAVQSTSPWTVGLLCFVCLLVLVPLGWVLIALVFTPLVRFAGNLTGRSRHDLQALITPSIMLLLAVLSAARNWPGAPLGWLWIGLTVTEIVSTVTCTLLKSRIAALDARLPSEAP